MPNPRLLARALFAASLAFAAPAHAQLFRAYLSAAGVDTNPCTLQQPCRLLPAGLDAVASGGEVWILDTANYNTAPVTIAKSVTIIGVPGTLASLVVTPAGPAVRVLATNLSVTLRNLLIGALPNTTSSAVVLSGASRLVLQGCSVAGPMNGNGVAASAGRLVVEDSAFRGNTFGIHLSGSAEGTVSRATFTGNLVGGVNAISSVAGSIVRLHMSDSVVQGSDNGVIAYALGAGTTVLATVTNSLLAGNGIGLRADGINGGIAHLNAGGNTVSGSYISGLFAAEPGARIWASGNIVATNEVGFSSTNGALFETAGNNALRNNGSATLGEITPRALQ